MVSDKQVSGQWLVQQVRVLATETDSLRSFSQDSWWKEKMDSHKLSFDLSCILTV